MHGEVPPGTKLDNAKKQVGWVGQLQNSYGENLVCNCGRRAPQSDRGCPEVIVVDAARHRQYRDISDQGASATQPDAKLGEVVRRIPFRPTSSSQEKLGRAPTRENLCITAVILNGKKTSWRNRYRT